MALGNASVNALDQKQGPFETVEKYLVFIGQGGTNQDTILYLNTDSDLDVELGEADSELKRQVVAAKLNAGDDWAAVAVPLADGTLWDPAVDLVVNENIGFEGIVLTTPMTAQADLTAVNAKAAELLTLKKRVFFITTARAIDSATESWSEYITDLNDLTDELVADRVMCVPYIYNNAAGLLAGRLCRNDVSVADTPMRVKTGSIIGQDQSTLPVDSNDLRYSNAHAKALNDQRFTVPAMHEGYPGVYWSDGQMLTESTSDFSVIENLRIVDKAARAIYVVLVGLIGDRALNSTTSSQNRSINALTRPLREMASSSTIGAETLPADIDPPKKGNVVIHWPTRTTVQVFFIVSPKDIPKDLTGNVLLDLDGVA